MRAYLEDRRDAVGGLASACVLEKRLLVLNVEHGLAHRLGGCVLAAKTLLLALPAIQGWQGLAGRT